MGLARRPRLLALAERLLALAGRLLALAGRLLALAERLLALAGHAAPPSVALARARSHRLAAGIAALHRPALAARLAPATSRHGSVLWALGRTQPRRAAEWEAEWAAAEWAAAEWAAAGSAVAGSAVGSAAEWAAVVMGRSRYRICSSSGRAAARMLQAAAAVLRV